LEFAPNVSNAPLYDDKQDAALVGDWYGDRYGNAGLFSGEGYIQLAIKIKGQDSFEVS